VKSHSIVLALVLALGATPSLAAESAPLVVSGFVESAYAACTQSPGGRIVGNLYLPEHDTFLLGAADVKVERAAPPDRAGAGFTLEAMAGNQAGVVRAAGLDLGEHADVVQAFGTIHLPSSGVQLSIGKMATMLGQEVIPSVANPNLSVGSQYVFLENFTDFGVDASWTSASGWSARARLVNGWDVVTDNNSRKTVFGKVGWSGGNNSVALFGYTGTELPDSVGGQRSGGELLATTRFSMVSATLQLDAGREEALDASWQAAGIWIVAPLRAGTDLALRADALNDADGVRTSGALGFPSLTGQTVYSATATLVLRSIPGWLIRPEVRYDHSDATVFDGEHDQWTVAAGAALLF
jgi:hypothetical protein